MILNEGQRQMEAVGYAHFSARELAKRIGYSIGTIYNVFGTHDNLIHAINGETLEIWRRWLAERLADTDGNRLHAAVEAYFAFALAHKHAWMAIYDFRLPDHVAPMPEYAARVDAILCVVVDEVRLALTPAAQADARSIAMSLLATVHGHCFFALNGTFRILGEEAPMALVFARVDEIIASANQRGASWRQRL